MNPHDSYQLLDFGDGRKLERFAGYVVDRPSPAAEGAARRDPAAWRDALARYDRHDGPRGEWIVKQRPDESWTVRLPQGALGLRLTEWGQVGLFPEQFDNWRWIGRQVRSVGQPCNVLNLFAYTGASTLAAAAAGAQVTHVDAAAGVVDWARCNAALSELSNAPVRWITDDVLKFARRELKRGRRYDGVILDPPRYGHGPGGEVWQLEANLAELVDVCVQLMGRDPRFFLLTCHSGDWGRAEGLLRTTMAMAPALREHGSMQASDMTLSSAAGGSLHAGAQLRWSSDDHATEPAASASRHRMGDRR